jgi:hypothetical protein
MLGNGREFKQSKAPHTLQGQHCINQAVPLQQQNYPESHRNKPTRKLYPYGVRPVA